MQAAVKRQAFRFGVLVAIDINRFIFGTVSDTVQMIRVELAADAPPQCAGLYDFPFLSR
jgi:hypothetical protein